jgi:hypothetical protein
MGVGAMGEWGGEEGTGCRLKKRVPKEDMQAKQPLWLPTYLIGGPLPPAQPIPSTGSSGAERSTVDHFSRL